MKLESTSRKGLEDKLDLANVLMGVGILFTVVPMGFTLISILASDKLSLHEAYHLLGWTFIVVYALLPLGMGMFVGGFTWTIYLKRALAAVDEAEDEAEQPTENAGNWP